MINILTGTPFEDAKRLHHREDEVALEGDSSAGSRRALLGARGAMFCRSVGGWRNPYITDGLVAMWDGEWNAGGGVHDSNATDIVNLVGDNALKIFGSGFAIGDQTISIKSLDTYAYCDGLEFGTPSTQEIVCCVGKSASYGRFIGENRGFAVYGPKLGYVYGFGLSKLLTALSIPQSTIRFHQAMTVSNGALIGYYYNGGLSGSARGTSKQYSGTTYFFNRSDGQRGITGDIHCIRFYSRDLTSEEIAANYAVDKARFGLT